MDIGYWGFSRWPFLRGPEAITPDTGQAFDEALARLLFLVDERRRCGLLTGDAGTGKSRLFRRIKSYAQRKGARCLEIDATGSDGDQLARQVTEQLLSDNESESVSRCWSLVHQQLTCDALIGQPVVVLVEHLDLAERGSVRALRRLINAADAVRCDLTVLISARTALPADDLRDCIELSIFVSGWSPDETAQFVTASLRSVGSENLLTPDALDCLYDITGGIPGEVIRVCDLSLLAAMSDQRPTIDASVVAAAAIEADPQRWSTVHRHSVPQFIE